MPAVSRVTRPVSRPIVAAPPRTERMGAEERARYEALRPSIERHSERYGVDPLMVAALIRQESRFRNLRVHMDGTGHGLAGLDDNGLRRDFERWSGLHIGPGRNANIVSADKQIEYVARRLAQSKARYGSEGAAVREWHRGAGNMNDRRGHAYEQLLRGHRAELLRN